MTEKKTGLRVDCSNTLGLISWVIDVCWTSIRFYNNLLCVCIVATSSLVFCC